MIRSTEGSPITAFDQGKWAVRKSSWTDGFCGRPLLIVRCAGSRVYYRDVSKVWSEDYNDYTFEPDDFEQYMTRDSIVYVCSTIEEAAELYRLSEQQSNEIRSEERAIRERYKEKVSRMC